MLGSETRRVATFLLELHRGSHVLGYRAMQRAAFAQLRELVAFDGGSFAVGTIQDGVATVHDVFLFDKPTAMLASWQAIREEDRLALAAAESPGVALATAITDPLYAGCDRMRAHAARFGLEYQQCSAHVYEAGLYWLMKLYRSTAPFSEADRVMHELVSPHLFAATRSARILEWRTLARYEGQGHIAIAGVEVGPILETEAAFVDALRTEWPHWRGPFLPEPLEAELARAGRYTGRRVVVTMDVVDGARLVHVRPRVAADELTDREREIASAFALGESHREIGDRLRIAPATVRRHLANLYDKLGVSSKAELDRMLRD